MVVCDIKWKIRILYLVHIDRGDPLGSSDGYGDVWNEFCDVRDWATFHVFILYRMAYAGGRRERLRASLRF
jgi:hypothetical protein